MNVIMARERGGPSKRLFVVPVILDRSIPNFWFEREGPSLKVSVTCGTLQRILDVQTVECYITVTMDFTTNSQSARVQRSRLPAFYLWGIT